MSDLISRQAAIDALKKISFSHWFECGEYLSEDTREIEIINSNKAFEAIEALPSAQLDGIPLEWIDKHLEWLDNCDNDFAQLAKVSIKAMVELWKKDRI